MAGERQSRGVGQRSGDVLGDGSTGTEFSPGHSRSLVVGGGSSPIPVAGMRAQIRGLPRGSLRRGPLPRGCVLCQKGAKMVLLVTGKCGAHCWYCPLSAEKRGRDVVFADEMRVRRPADVLREASMIDAEGTGITGGDPMLAPRRTLSFIRLLKKRFGREHHIHLYTAGHFSPRLIRSLALAGLDELRIHPPPPLWRRFGRSHQALLLGTAIREGIQAGAEVPAIPGMEEELLALARSLDALGARFLNLNELEYSETNFRELNRRGWTVRSDVSSAVLGSEETARRVVERADVEMALHYCSSSFKDGVQLRRRILRRARNVARPYQLITSEGTLLTGIIEGPPSILAWVRRAGVPAELSAYNRRMRRVEAAPWLLEELAPRLRQTLLMRGGKGRARVGGPKIFIVEEYPTADGLEVERTPL
ncbi:MAG: radical SAM protein [Thermoplasmata archaeon]